LEGSNSLLKDITPMVSRSPCVRHALLAVAATYVLDYKPDPLLENIANEHHKEAIKLLGEDLSNHENYAPGKEEPIIAAMILLNQDDVSLQNLSPWNCNDMSLGDQLGVS
jgi:hypothetical protein